MVKYIHNSGFKLGAFIDQKDNYKFPDYVEDIHKIDLSSQKTATESLKKLNAKPDGLTATYESYILPKSWIGEYYGLHVPTVEAAEAATDKELMRKKFQEYDPSITPDYKHATKFEDIEEFMKEHEFPVMLKPTNLFKSLLVTKCDNQEELERDYKEAVSTIKQIYKQYGVKNREANLIIEDYLDGPTYSIEAFADADGEVKVTEDVVDLVMGRDLGVDDNYNYSRLLPSELSEEKKDKIKEVAVKGMKALGLTNSPGHTELVYTKQGPKLIEIGARVGGYRPRMYSMAKGIDLHEVEINLSLGLPIDLENKEDNSVIVFEIFPEKEGKLKEITNIDKVKELPSYKYRSIKKEKGELVGLSGNGYKMTAIVILTNSDKGQFEKDREFIENEVKVIVE